MNDDENIGDYKLVMAINGASNRGNDDRVKAYIYLVLRYWFG